MIDRLIQFLGGGDAPATRTRDDLESAVAALLIEAAHMDSDFSSAERTTIERMLEERLDLSPDRIAEVLAQAEARVKNATQLHPFTREICRKMPREQRIEIIEMLWKVAYADGELDADEDSLIRRVASLIHVEDKERAVARQRALKKM
jgi:uncharacterized tellurite resistance protein B-like protein